MVTKEKTVTEDVAVKVEQESPKRQRRTWSEDQKKQIVREALAAGTGKWSGIAIRNGIAPNLLYLWIDAYKDEVAQHREAPVLFGANETDDIGKLKAENQKLRAMLADYLLREKLYG